jgi:type VI protein secretion system component VasK
LRLRIVLSSGPRVRQGKRAQKHVLSALALALSPFSLCLLLLAFWCLASQMNLAGELPAALPIQNWLFWAVMAAGVKFLSLALLRESASLAAQEEIEAEQEAETISPSR